MKPVTVKILSLSLVMALLLPAVTACGNTDDIEQGTMAETVAATEADTPSEADIALAAVADADWGGNSFTVLYNSENDAFKNDVYKVSAFVVPSTVPAADQDMIGAVLECMAAESYKTTVDAYYNTALSARYMNNPESKVMLDLAYDSVAMTAHQIYTSVVHGKDNKGVLTLLRDIVSSKENTVTSTFKGSSSMLATSVQEVNKAYYKILELD